MDMVSPSICQIHDNHRGSDFEDGRRKTSPHIGDSFGEVVRESPLLEGGQTVCDHMPNLGQISEVATHDVRCTDLEQRKISECC